MHKNYKGVFMYRWLFLTLFVSASLFGGKAKDLKTACLKCFDYCSDQATDCKKECEHYDTIDHEVDPYGVAKKECLRRCDDKHGDCLDELCRDNLGCY
jgi:hypothetical protein